MAWFLGLLWFTGFIESYRVIESQYEELSAQNRWLIELYWLAFAISMVKIPGSLTSTIPCPNQLFSTAKNYPLNDGKQMKHNTKRSPPGIKRGWKNHEKSLSMEGFKGPSTINGWIFHCQRYRRVKYLQLDNLVRFPSRLLLLNFDANSHTFAENPHLCRLN